MWDRVVTKRRLIGCGGKFSFYHDLIAKVWAGGPDEVRAAPLHRICTLARKMGVRQILSEDALAWPEVADELDALERLDGGVGEVRASALTFLCRPVHEARPLVAGDVIGQAILVTYPSEGRERTYVYEAAMRLPHAPGRAARPLLNNYVPLRRSLEINVDGQTLSVEGSLFCQGNGSTSVCAHSVVRGLRRDIAGERTRTADLNDLWDLARPSDGVGTLQLGDALSKIGHSTTAYDFDQVGNGDEADPELRWAIASSLVGSGARALLTFGTGRAADHVVPIIGYTLNTDEWHPGARAVHGIPSSSVSSSSLWVDHLVIHDDQLGPYFCMSRSFFGADGRRAVRGLTPKQVLAVLPTEVQVTVRTAEAIVEAVLRPLMRQLAQHGYGASPWWNALVSAGPHLVIRTTLVERKVYVEHLSGFRKRRRAAVDPAVLEDLQARLPHTFWMCEVTLPQLFAGNRAKLGELLVRVAPYSDETYSNVIAFRLPTVLGVNLDDKFQVYATMAGGREALLTPAHHGNAW